MWESTKCKRYMHRDWARTVERLVGRLFSRPELNAPLRVRSCRTQRPDTWSSCSKLLDGAGSWGLWWRGRRSWLSMASLQTPGSSKTNALRQWYVHCQGLVPQRLARALQFFPSFQWLSSPLSAVPRGWVLHQDILSPSAGCWSSQFYSRTHLHDMHKISQPTQWFKFTPRLAQPDVPVHEAMVVSTGFMQLRASKLWAFKHAWCFSQSLTGHTAHCYLHFFCACRAAHVHFHLQFLRGAQCVSVCSFHSILELRGVNTATRCSTWTTPLTVLAMNGLVHEF